MDWIPSISACCYCVPLKIGSVIIAIIGILSAFSIGIIFSENDTGSEMSDILELYKYVVVAAQIALVAASILLLIGIFMDNNSFGVIWVYVALTAVIIGIVYAILASPLFYPKYYKGQSSWEKTGTFLIVPLFWLYCVVVVKSYSED